MLHASSFRPARALALVLFPAVVHAQAAPPATSLAAPEPPAPVPTGPATPGAPAQANVRYVVDGGRAVALHGDARMPLAIEGPVLAVHRDGGWLYVARGTAGVAVYDVSEPLVPRLSAIVPTNGSATAFHAGDGQVWVVLVSKSAVPLDPAAGIPAGAPGTTRFSAASPPPATTSARRAARPLRVSRVTPGTVRIDGGKDAGVGNGQRFVVFRGAAADGEPGFEREQRVGVVEVVAVKEDTALAEVGRGARVREGDALRRAGKDDDLFGVYPPRLVDAGEVAAVVRPLVNAGRPLGVGVLAELEASYWTDTYFAGVRLQPVGLGVTGDGNIVSTAALLEGGYDGHAFSVGLGAGLSWVNGDLDHMLDSFGGSSNDSAKGGTDVEEVQETHAAFTLSQVARFGARDGLNLWLHNLLLLHDGGGADRSGFIYGGTAARLAVPVDVRSDLFLEGGGGVMGYWFAGIGVSTWITGNGAPGSYRLSVSAGAAGIHGSTEITETYPPRDGSPAFTSTYDEDVSVVGPMVSLGLAWRYAL